MKKSIIITIALFAVVAMPFTACKKGLDYKPYYGLNAEAVYSDPENYVHVLAKIYGSFVLTGNQGPSGQPDITGFDEGASGYIRVLWNLQELPTDEAVCGWSDPGIPELHNLAWSSDNQWIKYMYYRIYFTVPMCNEFIRESADSKLKDRGFSETERAKIATFRDEARFVRALAYSHIVDMFGGGPFITEDDQPGAFNPPYKSRSEMFNYVESELLAIEGSITAARQAEYGHADKAAVWSLLAKLYLNAGVYTGTLRYADARVYCEKVIAAGYSLETQYKNLFLADNNKSQEIIFPITASGKNTQTYGCTSFLVHAALGGNMVGGTYGVSGTWAGLRTTPEFVSLFPDSTLDGRYLFYRSGQSLTLNDTSWVDNSNHSLGVKGLFLGTDFKFGYALPKYKNIKSTGGAGSDLNYVDIDFPMFRLADVYLMYAEAVLHGGGGNMGTAIGYLNALRQRAYGNSSSDIGSYDDNYILAERGRELQWEATRRTDLIRFGKFAGSDYKWSWKGGEQFGSSPASYINLYPLPASDIAANPNLTQNPGY